MPKKNIVIPHKLTQEEALRRIKKGIEEGREKHADLVQQFNVTETWEWEGYTGTCIFSGKIAGKNFSVSGTITVESEQVKITADVPWVAMPFKKKFENMLKEEMEELLA